MLRSTADDLRYAVRSLRAAPTFTAVALAVLALSVGASTTVFSVVDAVILRGLPFEDGDRLVSVGEQNTQEEATRFNSQVAPQNFFDWDERQDVFSDFAAVHEVGISLQRTADGVPENLRAQRVTADFFDVLRVAPAIGRAFTADNEVPGRNYVTVISHALWQRRFGGAADVVGRRLAGQLADFEIVGVMPPSFSYPVDAAEPTDVWVPFVPEPTDRIRGNTFGYYLHAVARLRDGVSIEAAQARMEQITAGMAAETPRWFENRAVVVQPLHAYWTSEVRAWMLMLLGAIACVMLIACVNLANLLLVRSLHRSQELRVRAALGASRWSLARPMLVESVLLSAAGAGLGVLLAGWGIEVVRAVMPADVPQVAGIALDVRVLAATALAAALTGVLFGVGPAWQQSRAPATAALQPSSRTGTAGPRAQQLRAALVVAEMALAVVLLVGAGLFLASFSRVSNIDLGLDHRNVLSVNVRPLIGAQTDASVIPLYRTRMAAALESITSLPGVHGAAWQGGGLPLRADLRTVALAIPGRELPRNSDIAFNQVSPAYFDVLRIPPVGGRWFTDADTETSAPVAILNAAAARQYFGSAAAAIGQRVRAGGERTIVGVAGDVRHDGPEHPVRPQAFVPFAQGRGSGATLLVRTAPGNERALAGVLAAIARDVPDTPIPVHVEVRALHQYYDALVAERRFNMLIVSLFGALGMTIAAIGIYGVMAYAAAQRTREIGIRVALGAVPAAVFAAVVLPACRYMAAGLALGIGAAWALSSAVEGLLFQVRAHDPLIYALASLCLVGAALAATFVPARRAARLDPVEALRLD